MGVDCILFALVANPDESLFSTAPEEAKPEVVSSICCFGHGGIRSKDPRLSIVQCCNRERYFSLGYPRGNWADIVAAAHWLWRTFPGCSVYYGPDNAYWEWLPLTQERENELTNYFGERGNVDYYQAFIDAGIDAHEAHAAAAQARLKDEGE